MKQVLSVADFATIMGLIDERLNVSMPTREWYELEEDYQLAVKERKEFLENDVYYQNLVHLKQSLQNLNIEVECPDVEIKEGK